MQTENHPPVVAVFGPTAVGKSALGLALAEKFGGEIVSADSRQVYKYMDIGTDKPSQEDRERAAHHLVDLVEPDQPFTLANYQDLAYRAIDAIHARGGVPFLGGGTPLYVNAVLEGWIIPRVVPDPALRQELEREANEIGSEQLHARLAALDPYAAERILPSNMRRIVRALEVILTTGSPISEQQRKALPPYRILKLALQSRRDVLLERIDRRVDTYIQRGLVDEVAALHERGYAFTLPAMSGIGYRQIGEYLLGRSTLADAVQRIKFDTHAFTRHQGNWFRRAIDATPLDTTAILPLPEAEALVRAFLPGKT